MNAPLVETEVVESQRPPVAWATWSILGSTVAVFALQVIAQHIYGEDVLGDALAFSPQAWSEHRYWTLFTYAWAHAITLFGDSNFFGLHLVANMIPLYCIGPVLEQMLGWRRFLGLYLGGVVVSALVWLWFDGADDPGQGIVGASGAVFALIAAIGAAMPRQVVKVYLLFVLPLSMRLGVFAIAACAAELAQQVFGWFAGVAHMAHLGGAAFGCLYIVVLRWLIRRQRRKLGLL
jgi:membrane associated rhomboid family serine protease